MSLRGRAQQRLAVERQRATRLRQQIKSEESAIASLEGDLEAAHGSVETLTAEDSDLARELTVLQATSEDEKQLCLQQELVIIQLLLIISLFSTLYASFFLAVGRSFSLHSGRVITRKLER